LIPAVDERCGFHTPPPAVAILDARQEVDMALDEASQAFMAQLVATPGLKPLHEMTPTEARGVVVLLNQMAGEGPKMARVDDRSVDTPTGPVPVRVLVPEGTVRGLLVWFHGGGWVIGSVAESDVVARKLAARTRCAVVNVDYRMAPEHRFPVAVDDSYAALEWASAHMAEIAGATVPLIVGGDSAGGNLAAVMAQRARDRKGPRIALQLLVYPVTDADFTRPSYVAADNQLLLARPTMEWFWNHYAPGANDRAHPDASPLRAEDVTGLPPAIVLTAEHDVLRDEGEAYAQRLESAGVPTTFKRFAGQLHGFFTLVNVVPGHELGLDFAAAAIDKALS
jgi:acetyl esterase